MPAFEAVGYRVVHPGPKLREHVRITPEVLADLEAASEFAPLHDPEAVQMIRAFMKKFPTLPHYACFDTVFHQTMPAEASTYALPREYAERGVRRYGFHGLSCESIVRQLQARGRCAAADGDCAPGQRLQRDGAARWALGGHDDGADADGRGGDGNAARAILIRGWCCICCESGRAIAIAEVEAMLNHASGMVALSGMENDVKAMREAAANGICARHAGAEDLYAQCDQGDGRV